MNLNSIQSAPGARKSRTRVGRGGGSGLGKTCGRGHKGQHSRAGGYHKVGFEGGQMPLQRRQPKFGFRSAKLRTFAEIRLHELEKVIAEKIDLAALHAADLISSIVTHVKVIASGTITKPVVLSGIPATKGAKAAIEAAGGRVEE